MQIVQTVLVADEKESIQISKRFSFITNENKLLKAHKTTKKKCSREKKGKLVISLSANFVDVKLLCSILRRIKNAREHNKINYDYKHRLLFKL